MKTFPSSLLSFPSPGSLRKVLMLAAFLGAVAGADLLLQYNFEPTPGSSTFTASPTFEATGITGSTFSVTGDDDGQLESSSNADTPGRSTFEWVTTGSGTGLSTGRYWSFTVTSASLLDLSDLRFAIGKIGDVGSRFNVRSSVDGYAADLVSPDFTRAGNTNNNSLSAPENQVVDLSGAAFQDLDASSGVTFRIYYGVDGTPDGNRGVRLDSVSLNVIPEPSSLLLAGLGLLGLALLRGRRG